jgi:hypothetical protein
LTTTGTGFPTCVIYDRDTVLGGKEAEYPPKLGDSRMIYYDIGMMKFRCSLTCADWRVADLGETSECRTMYVDM